MSFNEWILIGAVTIASFGLMPSSTDAQSHDIPLIPREILFGNPDRSSVQLSPNGERIAWLAPRDGVMNIWVASPEDIAYARPVTNDRHRGIRVYFWAYTNDTILYLQDEGGDEDWRLYSVDVNSGESRDLTPFDSIPDPKTGEPMTDPVTGRNLRPTAQIQHVSHLSPEQILIGLNNRDPRFHDIHRLDLSTGELSLIERNEQGFGGYVTDDQYRVRLAVRPRFDGGQDVLRKSDSGEWELFTDIPFDDTLTTQPLGFAKDGHTVYMIDSRSRNTAALTAVDLRDDRQTILATDPRADIGGVVIHPTERTVQAVSANYLRREWKILDANIADDFAYLRTVTDGDFSITSRTLDDKQWIVAFVMDNAPVRYYRYDREQRRAHFLFTNRDALENLPLATMHPAVIPARDGLDLVSYYTLPVWSDTASAGKPTEPLPMVLLVHGGPWARDAWGYNPLHQWLANRGYAVLSVNFRGSTGFGKSFINAGNQEWAAAMHTDLLDAVDWAIDQGIADPDRIAIMGGSYGGYATLAGMTFTPTTFACGVSIVGPSNLITLLESIPPYWAAFRDQLRKRVGDIDTPEGRILLRSRSPLTHVDEIRRPLLIGQGANDPRVKQQESDQIVHAMQAKRLPVTYVLFPDEGHGFARPENRLSFYAVTEAFLSQHLHGVYEEIGNDFVGSSITVPVGADDVPGVSEALER